MGKGDDHWWCIESHPEWACENSIGRYHVPDWLRMVSWVLAHVDYGSGVWSVDRIGFTTQAVAIFNGKSLSLKIKRRVENADIAGRRFPDFGIVDRLRQNCYIVNTHTPLALKSLLICPWC